MAEDNESASEVVKSNINIYSVGDNVLVKWDNKMHSSRIFKFCQWCIKLMLKNILATTNNKR